MIETIPVFPHSPTALKERVFRLRHDVYVTEMHLPIQGVHGMLCDDFDARSVSFLATESGCDVGTIRVTCRAQGPLELELQSEDWKGAIDRTGFAPEQVHEFTRFMVRPEWRGGPAGLVLLTAASRFAIEHGSRSMVFAAKMGRLGAHYRKFGATSLAKGVHPYKVQGQELGRYVLCRCNYGSPRSIRRIAWSAWINTIDVFVRRAWLRSVFDVVLRRGDGFRPGRGFEHARAAG